MNLDKLFQMQKVLDDRILDEHPELKGKNNLDWKILALQVELGECANEWRGFKKWSKDQEPRTHEILVHCDLCGEWTDYTHEVEGITETKKPLLEEYVDCLHFILSIGLENAERYGDVYPIYFKFNSTEPIKYESITKHFNYFFNQTSYFMDCVFDREWGSEGEIEEQYEYTFRMFIGLGEMLGFTWEQIEQAYYDKNKINHLRQSNGY